MDLIYMDYAASTPVHEDVIQVMIDAYKEVFGNPSSIHTFGREARKFLDEARRTIAHYLSVDEREIVFTSGGTEADNMAIIGTALANQHKGKHIITTSQEHHAVLHAVEYLEENGFEVTYLPVTTKGVVDLTALEKSLTDDTILVSVMFANNETGVIQPIKKIGNLLKDHQAIFHTDAVQALGLLPIHVEELKIDLLSASGHKINGPKGSGFLYIKEGVQVSPLLHGGEQERKRRAGTENVSSIIGLEKAVEIAFEERENRYAEYESLKKIFLQSLKDEGVNFEINGDENHLLPTIVNLSFPGTEVEKMLTNLDLEGIGASSGSACTAGSIEASHVLMAMFGKEDERTTNSVRFSFGRGQTEEEMKEAARRISKIVQRLTGKVVK